jgi:hypothetical protein
MTDGTRGIGNNQIFSWALLRRRCEYRPTAITGQRVIRERARGGSMRLGPKSCAVLLLAAFFPCQMNSQTATSGGLAGVVSDPSHAVLPDAHVEIKDAAKGSTQSTNADNEGVYRIFFLAPSTYTLTVEREAFRQEIRVVSVLLGPPKTQSLPWPSLLQRRLDDHEKIPEWQVGKTENSGSVFSSSMFQPPEFWHARPGFLPHPRLVKSFIQRVRQPVS